MLRKFADAVGIDLDDVIKKRMLDSTGAVGNLFFIAPNVEALAMVGD